MVDILPFTIGGLIIALVLFSISTYRTWKRIKSIRSSLKLQLSLVVVFWLASELSAFFITGNVLYGTSTEITLFDLSHLASMGLFAGVIVWRTLRVAS